MDVEERVGPLGIRRRTGEILHGQSASFVGGVRPAAHVVRAISEAAEAILDSRPRSVLGRPPA
ncbi:hypothetical protein [Streptomyces sp. NPDC054804]